MGLVPQSLEQGAAAVSAACTSVLMAPSGKAFLSETERLCALNTVWCWLVHVAVRAPPAALRLSPAHPASAGSLCITLGLVTFPQKLSAALPRCVWAGFYLHNCPRVFLIPVA